MLKLNLIISLAVILHLTLEGAAQTKLCEIVDGFVNPGQYSIEKQVENGFCCSLGDSLVVFGEDRATVVFNYCKPIANQQSLVYFEARFVFVSVSTLKSRPISITLKYYVFEPPTSLSAVETTPSTATTTKFATLSTAAATTATTTKVATLSTSAATTTTPKAITASTFGTLSTAGFSSTTGLSNTESTRFPTLSTAGITPTQQVTQTAINLSTCPPTPKYVNGSTAQSGLIQSPNYPNRYPNNANCYWGIVTQPDEKIYLEFERINLPTFLAGVLYENCPSDYLAISDVNKPDAPYKLCGDRSSFRIIIPYTKVLIHFYSNGITESQLGFRLTYRIVKTGTTRVPTTTSPSTTTRSTTTTTTASTRSTTTISTASTATTSRSTTTTTVSRTTSATTASSGAACGVPYYTPIDTSLLRIIGGTESNPHSWPWTVLITDGSFICGATLINNNWLVTAAHCVDGLSTASFKAYLGMHNRATKDASTITRNIKDIVINPDYVGELEQWDVDIALLKLSEPVTFTNEIKPICLPSQGSNLAALGKTGMVVGWGRTKGFGSDQVLMQTTITVDSKTKCQDSSSITDNMICAGITGTFSHGSCEGDSGGPFMIMQNNAFYLAGIVSWGRLDCRPPSVYTKVGNFVSWINNIVSTR